MYPMRIHKNVETSAQSHNTNDAQQGNHQTQQNNTKTKFTKDFPLNCTISHGGVLPL